MQITTLLISAFLGATVSAVAIPANLPDGVYTQSFADEAEPVFLRSLNENEKATPEAIDKRENSSLKARFLLPSSSQMVCTNGFLDIPSMQGAQAGFYNTPGVCDGVWRTQSVTYYVKGTVIVYMCNYRNNPCASNEFDLTNGLLDGKCGSWKSGYVWIPDWQKTYGRDDYEIGEGANVCGKQIV